MKYFLAITLCFALGSLDAQAPPKPTSPDDDPASRIMVDVTRVNMLFTVSDKKGRFVTDLGKDEFEILEARKPQSIMEFTAESDLPLRIGILIDTSNSIRERFRFQQDAATDFVNAVVRPRQDKAMVVSFDSSAELVSDLTDYQLEETTNAGLEMTASDGNERA